MASQPILKLKTAKLSPPPPFPFPVAANMKKLSTPLTIFIYLLSLPALAGGIWLLVMRGYACETLLRMPPQLKIAAGVLMIATFLISNTVMLCGHRAVVLGSIVMGVVLTVTFLLGLVLVGAFPTESGAVPGSPMWLRMRVNRREVWDNVQACICDTGVCKELEFRTVGLESYDFSMIRLSPIESGCCNPPSFCRMEYVNATFWNKGKRIGDTSVTYTSFGDCNTWSNDREELCYNCHSCKEGFLKTIKRQWRQVGLFTILMSILFIVMHGARLVLVMSSEQYPTQQ